MIQLYQIGVDHICFITLPRKVGVRWKRAERLLRHIRAAAASLLSVPLSSEA